MSAAATVSLLRCAGCGRLDGIGRTVCTGCLSFALEPVEVAGTGRLATWTTIRRAPSQFRDDAPYEVAVIDLDAGPRVTGRLAPGGAARAVGAAVHARACDAPFLLFELLPEASSAATIRAPE
jgi:uncharacterized OB-fold protein